MHDYCWTYLVALYIMMCFADWRVRHDCMRATCTRHFKLTVREPLP